MSDLDIYRKEGGRWNGDSFISGSGGCVLATIWDTSSPEWPKWTWRAESTSHNTADSEEDARRKVEEYFARPAPPAKTSREQLAELLRPEDAGGLQGWCSRPKGEYLYDTVQALHHSRPWPLSCIEVGVFGGRSFIPVALALRDCDGGFITGIDPYTTAANVDGWGPGDVRVWVESVPFDAIRRRCEGVIEVLGLRRWAGLLRAEADRVAHLFGPVDLIHVDGNHAEASALRDVQTWIPKLTAGGVLVVDDVDWPSVRAARDLCHRRLKCVHRATTWEAFQR